MKTATSRGRNLRFGVKWTISAMVLSLALPGTSAGESSFPSHCAKTETVVFSCKLLRSEKYISLCGSQSLRAPDAYLIYRFGTLDQKTKFAYPADVTGSLQKFKSAHYFRAQVDRRDVSFSNSTGTYNIFSTFEGEEAPPYREGGVTMMMAGKRKGITLLCTTPYLDKLELLDGVVGKGGGYLDDDD